MTFKLPLIAVVLASVFSCSSDDSDPVVAVDGTYDLTTTPTTGFAINGGECVSGAGSIVIVDREITGTVMTQGLLFNVSGTVDNTGLVSGGFALSGESSATYEGTIENAVGSGTWEDNFECEGTWEATQSF